jgi:hypothetical protein
MILRKRKVGQARASAPVSSKTLLSFSTEIVRRFVGTASIVTHRFTVGPHVTKDVLTVEDIAAVLKVSPGGLRNRISRGLDVPPSFRAGRRRLFLAASFDQWLLDQASVSDPYAVAASNASELRSNQRTTGSPPMPNRGRPRQGWSRLA